MKQTANFIVLTGGPGVGKTAVWTALKRKGFGTVAEEARRIIKQQIETNGDGLPWKNKQRYATLMLEASFESYHCELNKDSSGSPHIFFDRGIPDTLAYIVMENLIFEKSMLEQAKSLRYHQKVFIFPPWREIYATDNERKQTWAEAEATFCFMSDIYKQLGYQMLEMPKTSIEQRCQFILQHLNEPGY